MLKHIPNLLTILRFFLIPVIVGYLNDGNYILASVFLTISGLTDVLDGFIARKFNFITNFGKLIDPLADKVTQIAVLAVLTLQNVIPLWILVIVLLKEFVMIAGASFLYGKELVVSSKWYGKLSTVLFYVAIVSSFFIKQYNLTIFNHPEYNMGPLPGFDQYIYYFALLMTIFSLLMYVKAFYTQGYLKQENLKINNKYEKK